MRSFYNRQRGLCSGWNRDPFFYIPCLFYGEYDMAGRPGVGLIFRLHHSRFNRHLEGNGPLVKTACKFGEIVVKQRRDEGAEIPAPEQNQRRGKEYRPRHEKSACPQVCMRLHRGAGDGGGKDPAAGGGPSGFHEGWPASCAMIDITGHQGRAFRLCGHQPFIDGKEKRRTHP